MPHGLRMCMRVGPSRDVRVPPAMPVGHGLHRSELAVRMLGCRTARVRVAIELPLILPPFDGFERRPFATRLSAAVRVGSKLEADGGAGGERNGRHGEDWRVGIAE